MIKRFFTNKWMITGLVGAVGLACGIIFGWHSTITVLIVITALAMGTTATLEAVWRMHGYRTPEAIDEMKFPSPTPAQGTDTFTLIVPACEEGGVLQHTLMQLAGQTHPNVEIIATLIEGDEGSIDDALLAQSAFPDRIKLLVRSYETNKKPYQLNAALEISTGKYIGVIDAEDVVADDLVMSVEAAFQRTNADIVQGGVQLMNIGKKLREWWCVHNVMEYFCWFSSRMFYQVKQGFVPLGGNTVFIRRDLLVQAGGWPDSLTEDCALGVWLTTEFNAKVRAFYDARLVTKEETPDDIKSFVKQRVRWNTGFGVELIKGQWHQLHGLKRKLLAWYILATPFLQALAGLLLPLTVISILYLSTPTVIAMMTFLPYIPIVLSALLQLVGLHEFGKMYEVKVRWRHYAWLFFGGLLYQWILAWAAFKSMRRIRKNDMSWDKTAHSNKHREVTVAPVAASPVLLKGGV